MLGRYKKRFAVYIGEKNKRSFRYNIENLIRKIPVSSSVGFNVVSFSGKKYLNDQLFSILSFYYNIGTPLSWKIYNDGTYDKESIELLKTIPKVEICELDTSGLSSGWAKAVAQFPTLKKMLIYKSVSIEAPTVLVDSDVLFFPAFKLFSKDVMKDNWYIQDESAGYFDRDFIEKNNTISNPLNLGLLIINQKPDWEIAFSYIERKIEDKSISYWTDQTAMQVMATLPGSAFFPLDGDFFVTNGSDSFKVKHDFNYNKIAVRHYVSPVRHKMWQTDWRKVLRVK